MFCKISCRRFSTTKSFENLIKKAERALKKGDIVQSDINRQLNEKRKSLVDILSAELCPAADRSLRAGARGQR